MTTKEAIKRAKRVKEEQWCECIGNCSCNAEGDKNALTHLISIAEREEETQTILSAWQDIFGTTQLTHAQARLEQVEKEVEKYKKLAERVDEERIKEILQLELCNGTTDCENSPECPTEDGCQPMDLAKKIVNYLED